MDIEIVSIGNEILEGSIVNSNAAEIGHALFEAGFPPKRQVVLPDDPLLLKQGLQESLQRNRFVITTGGLGPTCDDNTRAIAAELFNSDYTYNEEVAEELLHRYHGKLTSLKDQATVPTKATIMKNRLGTAPGLIFHSDSSTLIMLPGVPLEMRAMLKEQVIPFLEQQFCNSPRLFRKTLHFFAMQEPAVDQLVRPLIKENPELQFGIYPSLGLLTLHITVKESDPSAAEAKLQPPYQMIARSLAHHVFHAPSGRIEEAVQQMFVAQGWTLSAAESCTGGRLASRLVQIPGASKYFLGSLVVYSDNVKMNLLKVSPQDLHQYGAVSSEVVSQMAAGLLSSIDSDFGVAVTGIAGPDGGTSEKPVGTIWGAIIERGKSPYVWPFRALGSREMIIERCVNALLSELLRYCSSKILSCK